MYGTNEIKSHQPELFMSCKRLTVTASDGKKVRRTKIPQSAKDASTNISTIDPMTKNNVQNQNSDRAARPEKVKYFDKQVLTAKIIVI